MSTDHADWEFEGKLPKKSRRGRPPKPVTQAKIAELIGVSRRTMARAQAHVQAIEQYPELATSTLAVDKQIALAKRWRVGRSSPVQAQWLVVEALARELDALRGKVARVEQRYAEEWDKLLALRDDRPDDEAEA